jgi:hypothetical protein
MRLPEEEEEEEKEEEEDAKNARAALDDARFRRTDDALLRESMFTFGCGVLGKMVKNERKRLFTKNCVKNNCNPKVSTFIGEFWRKM